MFKWGCGAIIAAYFAAAGLIALGNSTSGGFSTICFILSAIVIIAGLFGVPVYSKTSHSRNVEAVRNENRRRYHNAEEYEENVREYNQKRSQLQREYEQDYGDWYVTMINVVSRRAGVDITEEWVENWTPVTERRRFRSISHTVTTARDNPPAHDELIEIGNVTVAGDMPELYRSEVLAALPAGN